MASRADIEDLLLPVGTRAFYIGAPKTGTTAIQQAAALHRERLAANHVYYPGDQPNHRRPIYAALGRPERPVLLPSGAEKMEVPAKEEWQRFIADINAKNFDRTLISHETASTATDAEARNFIRDIGPDRTHVIITLRPLANLLTARWVELLKEGETESFEDWLKLVDADGHQRLPAVMYQYLNMGELVTRWADAAGPNNVTVVVVDKKNKEVLTDTFERLLGLPARTLTGSVTAGDKTNRSLSMQEAELFRRVNARLTGSDRIPRKLYLDFIRSGAVGRILGVRSPRPDEPRVELPVDAIDTTVAKGREYADQIRRSGVRIVGDIDRLAAVPDRPDHALASSDHVDYSIAVEAIVGVALAAATRERSIASTAGSAPGGGTDRVSASRSGASGSRAPAGRRRSGNTAGASPLTSRAMNATAAAAERLGSVAARAGKRLRSYAAHSSK